MLKNTFGFKGKLHDVTLGDDFIEWTTQSNGRPGKVKANSTLGRLQLNDIFGAWMKKQKDTKDPSGPGQLIGLTLFTYSKGKGRKLCYTNITFECTDESICQTWIAKINDFVRNIAERPRKVKVVLNPRSRKGEAPGLYMEEVSPIFHRAGIKTDVLVTDRAGHAWEYFSTEDLSTYDGVVCVGGDGIVHEVINGLLEKAHREAGVNFSADLLPEDFVAVRPRIKVGVIPAGSTDVIAYSALGTNDPVTAAIHIILGHTQPLDVCSLENDGKLIRFCFSMAYGFLGDVLKSSELYRWMGPKRYKWAALKRLRRIRTYDVEARFLPSSDTQRYPGDQTRCRRGCEVCASPRDDRDTSEAEWKTITGPVVGLNFYTLPNLCDIAPDGSSPSCHLGDGYTDLVVIKPCTRLGLMSHIQRNFNSKDQFGFDFIETHRVERCEIRVCGRRTGSFVGERSSGHRSSRRGVRDKSLGVWNVDGELLRQAALSFRVHRQLLTFYGSGIEEISKQRSCCLK